MQHPDDAHDAGRDDAATHATIKAKNDATGATLDATRRANAATMKATQGNSDATADTDAGKWLSVAQAAQIEGVSVRAVQRRCQSGKYGARRIQTPQGERLEVDAATLTTQRRDDRRDERDDESPQRRDAVPENARADAAAGQQAAPDFTARYMAQIEAENAFLRATVEQHQRSEAELRAALREALKAQPRQLEGSTEGAGVSSTQVPRTATNAAPPTAQDATQQNATGAAPMKEPRPLWKLMLGIR